MTTLTGRQRTRQQAVGAARASGGQQAAGREYVRRKTTGGDTSGSPSNAELSGLRNLATSARTDTNLRANAQRVLARYERSAKAAASRGRGGRTAPTTQAPAGTATARRVRTNRGTR